MWDIGGCMEDLTAGLVEIYTCQLLSDEYELKDAEALDKMGWVY